MLMWLFQGLCNLSLPEHRETVLEALPHWALKYQTLALLWKESFQIHEFWTEQTQQISLTNGMRINTCVSSKPVSPKGF